MTGEIYYKYNNQFLTTNQIKHIKIQEYLIDIDFYNTLKLLYYNKPEKYIRKFKLKKLNNILK
jgi:hypothetical protein